MGLLGGNLSYVASVYGIQQQTVVCGKEHRSYFVSSKLRKRKRTKSDNIISGGVLEPTKKPTHQLTNLCRHQTKSNYLQRHQTKSCRRIEWSCMSAPNEDQPENLPSEFPTGLTLSQQLLFRSYIEEVKKMSSSQCQAMIVELVKQTMMKDNIMRSLLRQPGMSLTSQLPNPEEYQQWDGDPFQVDTSSPMIEPWPGFDSDTLKRKAQEQQATPDQSIYPDWIDWTRKPNSEEEN